MLENILRETYRPIQLSIAYGETKNREVLGNIIKGLIVSKLTEEKKEEDPSIRQSIHRSRYAARKKSAGG